MDDDKETKNKRIHNLCRKAVLGLVAAGSVYMAPAVLPLNSAMAATSPAMRQGEERRYGSRYSRGSRGRGGSRYSRGSRRSRYSRPSRPSRHSRYTRPSRYSRDSRGRR